MGHRIMIWFGYNGTMKNLRSGYLSVCELGNGSSSMIDL